MGRYVSKFKYYDDVKKYLTEAENDAENKLCFEEMSNFFKKDSGLSVNLWIDDEGKWKTLKHKKPRIKFQNNTGDKIQKNKMIPMDISKNPETLIKNFKSKDLDISDINEIKKFVIKYCKLLLEIAEGDGKKTITDLANAVKKNKEREKKKKRENNVVKTT